MPVTYTNRRGKTHYLHRGTTKTGKPKYFFSLKQEGDLVDEIPAGYEIYENPNTQVFLRKRQPPVFTVKELAIVEAGMKKFAKTKYFLIDTRQKAIVIYLAAQNIDDLTEMLTATDRRSPAEIKTLLLQNTFYTPMMQFVLDDEKTRSFIVQRWCFLGSVDDWITLDYSNDLKALVKKYCCHLGQESLFSLMPIDL